MRSIRAYYDIVVNAATLAGDTLQKPPDSFKTSRKTIERCFYAITSKDDAMSVDPNPNVRACYYHSIGWSDGAAVGDSAAYIREHYLKSSDKWPTKIGDKASPVAKDRRRYYSCKGWKDEDAKKDEDPATRKAHYSAGRWQDADAKKDKDSGVRRCYYQEHHWKDEDAGRDKDAGIREDYYAKNPQDVNVIQFGNVEQRRKYYRHVGYATAKGKTSKNDSNAVIRLQYYNSSDWSDTDWIKDTSLTVVHTGFRIAPSFFITDDFTEKLLTFLESTDGGIRVCINHMLLLSLLPSSLLSALLLKKGLPVSVKAIINYVLIIKVNQESEDGLRGKTVNFPFK